MKTRLPWDGGVRVKDGVTSAGPRVKDMRHGRNDLW